MNHAVRFERLAAELKATKLRCSQPGQENARRIYEDAILRHPNDHWLHHNYAEFLSAIGDLPQALLQMQAVRDLAPQHYAAYLQIARLQAKLKQYAAARGSLAETLRLRPDLTDAYVELSQISVEEKKFQDAWKQIAQAQKLLPDDPGLFLRQADVLAAMNRQDEMIQCLRAALRLRPAFWEARTLLGVELAGLGKTAEAQAEFEEAVQLRPDHPLGI